MTHFDYTASTSWADRFPPGTVGAERWARTGGRAGSMPQSGAAPILRPKLGRPRVFISHQRADEQMARWAADQVALAGFDWWLDILDPDLSALAGGDPSDEEKAELIATIVEVALLNSTHVLAIYTHRAAKSEWVPYEYGRVKAASVRSRQAAAYLPNSGSRGRAAVPYFLRLGEIVLTVAELHRWLAAEGARWG